MPQTTDIIINGAGYMIEPGTHQNPGYKRLQDGFPEGRTQRTSITDFFGGQRRAIQLERDTFADSLAIGPALGGQGVQPWALESEYNATNIIGTFPTAAQHIPHVIVRDTLYFAIGNRLYRYPHIAGGNTPPALARQYVNTITDLCIYQSFGILVALGSGADIQFFNTIDDSSTALYAGDRAGAIASYAGSALWSDARTASIPSNIRMVTGSTINYRSVDHDVIAITNVGAELMVVTKQALYTFNGRVKEVMVPNPAWTPGGTQPAQIPGFEWSGEFTPFFQQGVYTERDDFRFILGYGGRTIAWIAGGVHELVPSGERAGWRSTGLSGRRCFGGTVAAGYVIVAIESDHGNNELWAYDGNGWWRLASKPMPAGNGIWCNPIGIGTSGPNGWNLMIFHQGISTISLYRLVEGTNPSSGAYLPAMPATAQFVTPLIDASERDKPKAWRKVGAIFASPRVLGNATSTDNIQITLEYSIDAGRTWVNVYSAFSQTWAGSNGNSLAAMNVDIEESLSGVVSHFIMLRVRWGSVIDWAPVLVGAWVEHEILNNPARRRKWQLRIHARDQEIDRDGTMFSRTGRQLIDELWAAWETDTPLTFRDVDYDADPVQRTVRIVGISEHVAQPADAHHWGDSIIALNLVEV